MSHATPQMRDWAQRLMAYEAGESHSSAATAAAAFPICEKLRPPLATLMGHGGVRALLSRALALATTEIPWLRGVQVKPDGSLAGLAELRPQLDPAELFEGRVVLAAQLLGLLVAFIGATLTWRLVREVWPKAPLTSLNFGNGDQHEKTE